MTNKFESLCKLRCIFYLFEDDEIYVNHLEKKLFFFMMRSEAGGSHKFIFGEIRIRIRKIIHDSRMVLILVNFEYLEY